MRLSNFAAALGLVLALSLACASPSLAGNPGNPPGNPGNPGTPPGPTLGMPPGPWERSPAVALRKAAERDTLVIVDMYAAWCGWCKRLEQQVYPQKGFQDLAKEFVFLRVDTEDRKEGTELAARFKARSLPTTLLLAPENFEAGRVTGYMEAVPYVTAIRKQVENYEAFRKRIAATRNSKDPKEIMAVADELVERGGHAAAEERYERILAMKKIPDAVVNQATFQVSLAELEQRKVEEAEKHMTQLLARLKAGHNAGTDKELPEKTEYLYVNIFMSRKDWGGAQKHLERFKKNYPASRYVTEVDNLLRQLQARSNQPSKPGQTSQPGQASKG